MTGKYDTGSVLIIGATSAIAKAFAQEAMREGYSLLLAARNCEKLEEVIHELRCVDSSVTLIGLEFNALKPNTHHDFFQKVLQHAPDLTGCFIACGVMFPQEQCDADWHLCAETIACNYTGLVSIMQIMAAHFKERRMGFISCITSVAGDRGRRSNYLYGSSKAALNTYLQGLRSAVYPYGVLVQTVKAGPVESPMSLRAKHAPFKVQAVKVSGPILKAIRRELDIVYVPWFWRYIMLIIRLIPEFFFKRLPL